jgi:hypothetical protein
MRLLAAAACRAFLFCFLNASSSKKRKAKSETAHKTQKTMDGWTDGRNVPSMFGGRASSRLFGWKLSVSPSYEKISEENEKSGFNLPVITIDYRLCAMRMQENSWKLEERRKGNISRHQVVMTMMNE